MILATTSMENNRGGNGRYTPIRRRPQETLEKEIEALEALNMLNDPRMRFKNSRDPIYIAFDYVQRQSVKNLAKEFVKDIISDGLAFISKVTTIQ